MGPPEAPQAVSVGLRNCYLALPKRHKLFLYWASKLLSGTFSAPLKASKPSKPSQQLSTAFRCFAMGPPEAFDGLSLLCHGTSEAPQAVSIGRRKCYLARCSFRRPFAALPWDLPRPHELFLLGFETAIWHFRGATSCFYWASKLLSGTLQLSTAFRCFAMGPPEAPQAVGCFYWASKLLSGTFSAPLKSFKTLKTFPAAFAFDCLRCFAMGPPEAPRAVSVGLRNCYLTLPKRHKMFLFGFATAIWHVAAFDGHSLLCHGSYRGPTSCFCWASKLLSGTSEAPQAVSIGLRNCYLAHFPHPLKPSKASKPSQQLSTAFRCFAIGFRNCYLATPRRHKLFLLGFKTAIWHVFSTPKTVKGLKTLPAAFDGLQLLCHGTSQAPQAVSIGLRNCYLARCSFRRPFAALPWDIPRPTRHELFLLGFETPIWHVFSTP